jgi:hypothetical protein
VLAISVNAADLVSSCQRITVEEERYHLESRLMRLYVASRRDTVSLDSCLQRIGEEAVEVSLGEGSRATILDVERFSNGQRSGGRQPTYSGQSVGYHGSISAQPLQIR